MKIAAWIASAFLLVVLVASNYAKAETEIYLGAWSKHFVEGEYNEVHNMIGVNHKSWVVAYFKNSYERHTALLGKDFRWRHRDLHAGVIVGATHGYRECYGDNGSSAKTCPFIAPYVGYDAPVAPKFILTHEMAAIVGTVQF